MNSGANLINISRQKIINDMRQIGDMKLYTLDEVLDENLGKAGTPERDAFEADVEAEKFKFLDDRSSV